ncbi:MAG: hypothetical protein AAFY27_08625 [Pseudomonadota bacterium]
MAEQYSPTAMARLLLDDSTDAPAKPLKRYAPHGVRKTVFALVFLILMPFFVSLPAMIYQRVESGVWLDTWGLLVIALAFAMLMALVLFELIYALRAEIVLGKTTVRLVLPAGLAGAMPMLNYRTYTIAYEDIVAVEQRSEVFGGTLVPVIMVSTWLRLADHRRILLGAVNEKCTDHVFPFEQIGRQIAERAGVRFQSLGLVKRNVAHPLIGLKGHEEDGTPLDDSIRDALNKRHRAIVIAMVSAFACLLALGLATDILNASADLGERQPNSRPFWSSLF